jgi:hypothetical protein
LVGVNYKIISRVWKVRPALVGLEYNWVSVYFFASLLMT